MADDHNKRRRAAYLRMCGAMDRIQTAAREDYEALGREYQTALSNCLDRLGQADPDTLRFNLSVAPGQTAEDLIFYATVGLAFARHMAVEKEEQERRQ